MSLLRSMIKKLKGRCNKYTHLYVLHLVVVRYPIIPTSTRTTAIGAMTTIHSESEAWKDEINI